MLILAHSGSGKTTFVQPPIINMFKKNSHVTLVDADYFPGIRETYDQLRENFGLHWWEREDYAERIHPLKKLALTPVLRSLLLDRSVIAFTAEIQIGLDLWDDGHCAGLYAWVVDAYRVYYNMRRRKDSDPETGHPTWTLEDAIRHVLDFRRRVNQRNIPTVTTPYLSELAAYLYTAVAHEHE
jgi:hypothetical protein